MLIGEKKKIFQKFSASSVKHKQQVAAWLFATAHLLTLMTVFACVSNSINDNIFWLSYPLCHSDEQRLKAKMQ